jgi:CheY-like chemotaxis protein
MSGGDLKSAQAAIPLSCCSTTRCRRSTDWEVLKTIKADENLKIIPVVVLTSSRETPDLVEFYKHGVNAYVVKPVDFAEFMNVIKHLGIFWAAINEPPCMG